MYTFDPDGVAYAEAHGWRAYYERDWFKMLRLMVAMNQAQFRIPFPISWLAAFHVVRASIAFVPKDHAMNRVRALLTEFFKLARAHSGLSFDPARAAAVEAEYWDVHRRLWGKPDKTEFINTMIELHGLLFSLSPEQARESAEQRVLANNIVDTITAKTSADPEADWARLEDHLRRCYRSIAAEMNGTRVAA
jgi:hypothetical protein